jgi:spore germination cell wall hydrolase CwlJ-like protein
MTDASLQRMSDVTLLALVLWREARGESRDAKVAVAHSIRNRVERPSWWGKTLLEVLFKKWQYSSVTDPNDPQRITWPSPLDASWWECMGIARDVLAGALPNPVPGADSYYDLSIPAPKWADPKAFIARIGNLRFYDLDHDHELAVLQAAA